jgi:hypothetical protein
MHIKNPQQLEIFPMNPDLKNQIRAHFEVRSDKITKPSKFRNKKVIIDGITFDSKREGQGYRQLKALKTVGIIKELKLQVPFQIGLNGKKICKYYADFVAVYADGRQEVIDYKGMKTPVYNLKKKLVEAMFGIKIIER